MNEKEKQSTPNIASPKPESSPELPSKHMEDAKSDALVDTISEDEIDNKIAEETGKDQPLPEDIEEVNSLKDSEVEQIANEAASAVAAESSPPADRAVMPKQGKIVRIKRWCANHKVWAVILSLLVLLGVLAAIPLTRYAIAGVLLKQNFRVYVTDAETKKPIASANVIVDGRKGTTNSEGYVTISSKAGPATVDVNKAFYTVVHTKIVIPILKQKQPLGVSLKATGHKTTLTVIDKISGKPIDNVLVTADDGIESSTNSKGVAELVVPADKKTLKVKLMIGGYNTATTEITVGEALKANEFAMTPVGKIYFLSNKSGKIDVVKSDLDGANRETVIAGTGKEDASNTALLASRDWKYLALFSKRDGGTAQKIFLIDTATDKMTVMDEGEATMNLIGWSGHTFGYSIYRNSVKYWEPKRQALKSYNADTHKLATLDENEASGNQNNYIAQSFDNFYVVDDQVVYSVGWGGYLSQQPEKSAAIRRININGQGKKDVRSFSLSQYDGYLSARAYAPGEIYFWLRDRQTDKDVFFEYEDGTVKDIKSDGLNLTKAYPTYLQSPSGKETLWSDTRDGKLALFTGDSAAKGEKQIPGVSDYQAYGWYTDKYALATQKGSELYILPVDGGKPLKISDYYKPALDFSGYGSGYGGL